jgi:2-polyprenyl-3-methyl-5-hydroxy-6-metoxy-1,4-benzoquinol methylase
MQTPTWKSGEEVTLTCRACSQTGVQDHWVTVGHVDSNMGSVKYYRCRNCDSLNPVMDHTVGYTEPGSFLASSTFTKHYLQLGAGIDFMIRPLQRVARGKKSLLDVGCGFGYTLDYWCHSPNRTAVGLEASGYGALGSELLGVNIKSEYISPNTTVEGSPFDCVFTTEVIEHVDDPSNFVRALKKQVKDAGVVILTTPNAAYVQQTNPPSVVLAALSPGVHTVLFSKVALERLLHGAGFKYVDVQIVAERLVAYVSDEPLRISSDCDAEKQDYVSYISSKSGKSANPDLELGWCYRAAKELINLGDIQGALPFLEKYRDITKQYYELDCYDSERCSVVLANVKSHEDYAATAPFSLSCFLFYLGMFLAQGGKAHSDPDAAACFQASAKISGGLLKLPQQFSQEAATLYWPAFYESGVASLRAGRRSEAIVEFDKILSPRAEASSFGFEELAPKDDALRFRAAVQKPSRFCSRAVQKRQ